LRFDWIRTRGRSLQHPLHVPAPFFLQCAPGSADQSSVSLGQQCLPECEQFYRRGGKLYHAAVFQARTFLMFVRGEPEMIKTRFMTLLMLLPPVVTAVALLWANGLLLAM